MNVRSFLKLMNLAQIIFLAVFVIIIKQTNLIGNVFGTTDYEFKNKHVVIDGNPATVTYLVQLNYNGKGYELSSDSQEKYNLFEPDKPKPKVVYIGILDKFEFGDSFTLAIAVFAVLFIVCIINIRVMSAKYKDRLDESYKILFNKDEE